MRPRFRRRRLLPFLIFFLHFGTFIPCQSRWDKNVPIAENERISVLRLTKMSGLGRFATAIPTMVVSEPPGAGHEPIPSGVSTKPAIGWRYRPIPSQHRFRPTTDKRHDTGTAPSNRRRCIGAPIVGLFSKSTLEGIVPAPRGLLGRSAGTTPCRHDFSLGALRD